MKLKISDIIYYDQPNDKEFEWYLNLRSGKVENINDIISEIDVSKKYFYTFAYDYEYLALPYIDMNEICKNFLIKLNNRYLINYFKRLPRDVAESEFIRRFHPGVSTESDYWADFEFEERKKIVVNWCKKNNIQVILEA